jgi:glycosyltransferase involved in cell wall biosynthesis
VSNHVRSVLFVTTSFPRFHGDFAGSFVFRFAKYLAKAGINITVLAPGDPKYATTDDIEGVQIYRFPYFYPRRLESLAYEGGGILSNMRHSWLARVQVPLFFLATMRAILRYQDRVDLIHCHWLPTAIAALIARPLSRSKPVIAFTNWGSDTRLLPSWLTRWTLTRVDGCISTAIETDEHLMALGRTDFRRIMAPVDEERFVRTGVAEDIRRDLGIAEHIPVLPFIGRLDDFKDPLTFIRACAVLKQHNISFVAPIAGDGHLLAACQQEIERYALQDHVTLLGRRTDPERLLSIATATVHISPVENTWANIIAEAMFIGLPVVLSNAGYTERLFTHEKNCLIIPAQHPSALAGALRRLIENETLRQQLTSGAHDLLRQYKKDHVSIVQETLKYYNELFLRKSVVPHYA